MPIPDFNENGFLPPGVHPCTLGEVRARFGTFQGSERRPRLFSKLAAFLIEVRKAGIVRAVVINGSFVSVNARPNDIDLLLVVPRGHDFRTDLAPIQYNIVDRHRVRRVYGFDVFLAEEDTADYEALVRFFQRVRLQPHRSKGILIIEI